MPLMLMAGMMRKHEKGDEQGLEEFGHRKVIAVGALREDAHCVAYRRALQVELPTGGIGQIDASGFVGDFGAEFLGLCTVLELDRH